MKRFVTVIALLLLPLAAHAVWLFDTGTPTNLGTGYSTSSPTVRAAQFTLTQDANIDTIEHYMFSLYNGDFKVSIYRNTVSFLSGFGNTYGYDDCPDYSDPLYSGTFHSIGRPYYPITCEWYGVGDVNLHLEQGTYWVGITAAAGPDAWGALFTPPNPLQNYVAFWGSDFISNSQKYAVRIGGDYDSPAPVPEPATFAFLFTGLAGIMPVVRKLKK